MFDSGYGGSEDSFKGVSLGYGKHNWVGEGRGTQLTSENKSFHVEYSGRLNK